MKYKTATKTDINAFRCTKTIFFIGTLAILCSIFLTCNSNKKSNKKSAQIYQKSKQMNNIRYGNIYTFQRIR